MSPQKMASIITSSTTKPCGLHTGSCVIGSGGHMYTNKVNWGLIYQYTGFTNSFDRGHGSSPQFWDGNAIYEHHTHSNVTDSESHISLPIASLFSATCSGLNMVTQQSAPITTKSHIHLAVWYSENIRGGRSPTPCNWQPTKSLNICSRSALLLRCGM